MKLLVDIWNWPQWQNLSLFVEHGVEWLCPVIIYLTIITIIIGIVYDTLDYINNADPEGNWFGNIAIIIIASSIIGVFAMIIGPLIVIALIYTWQVFLTAGVIIGLILLFQHFNSIINWLKNMKSVTKLTLKIISISLYTIVGTILTIYYGFWYDDNLSKGVAIFMGFCGFILITTLLTLIGMGIYFGLTGIVELFKNAKQADTNISQKEAYNKKFKAVSEDYNKDKEITEYKHKLLN